MGIFDSAFDALGGTFADQWQDVITAGRFDEHSLVVHGVRRNSQNSRGSNKRSQYDGDRCFLLHDRRPSSFAAAS